MNFLAVFIGGGLGSVLRYALSLLIPASSNGFPLATFLANVLASVILVLAVKWSLSTAPDSRMVLLVTTGFCGGFSTFSTFSLENIQLISEGFIGVALLNVLLSLAVCFGLMFYLLSR